MKKSVFSSEDFAQAQIIHDFLRYNANSTCFNADGTLKEVEYIACLDDDPWSAVSAAKIFHQAVSEGQDPTMLCIGGVGLLSTWINYSKLSTKRYTEGMRLKEVCAALGVPEKAIIVLDKGINTGENIREIAKLMEKANRHGDILFTPTIRLYHRWERSFKKQIGEHLAQIWGMPEFLINVPNDYYFIQDQTLKEACCWMNGKRVGNCQMMFHELAAIVPLMKEYTGKFMLPMEIKIPKVVRMASNYLSPRYRIKLRVFGFQEMLQYPYLVCSLIYHLGDMRREQNAIIKKWQKQKEIAEKYGVKL